MRVAITGAAKGIGAEVAAKLKTAGHHVTIFDIHAPTANADTWIKTDLSDAASISAAAAQADGPFDALINNAGLPPRAGLQEMVLRVNFFGLRAFATAMQGKLAPGASIVNTASRAGYFWRDNIDEVKALMALDPSDLPAFIAERDMSPARAYNLSKEAVIVMSMAQTQDLIAQDLRINTVSPAAVSTDILQDFANAFGDKMTRNLALSGRPGEASEIADVIVFLASPQSGWIKGQDIIIDGGMTAIANAKALDLTPGYSVFELT